MKKKEPRKTHSEITTLSILPGTIVLGSCLLLASLILVFLFYRGGMITLPPQLERIFSKAEPDTHSDGFSDAFLSSLNGNTPILDSQDERIMDLSPEALLSLLLASTPAESLYQEVSITWVNGNDIFTTATVRCFTEGTRAHAEVLVSGRITKYITCNEEQFFIQENGENRYFRRSSSSDFSIMSEVGLPSLSRMQALISEAENGKYTLSLEISMDSPCIRATFTDTISGIYEIYEVMPDCGVILSAYSYLPDAQSPYYLMTTTTVMTDITGFDTAIFDIPEP